MVVATVMVIVMVMVMQRMASMCYARGDNADNHGDADDYADEDVYDYDLVNAHAANYKNNAADYRDANDDDCDHAR